MIKMKRMPPGDNGLVVTETLPGMIRPKQSQRHPPLPDDQSQPDQIPDLAVLGFRWSRYINRRFAGPRYGFDWTIHRRRMLPRGVFFHKGMASGLQTRESLANW